MRPCIVGWFYALKWLIKTGLVFNSKTRKIRWKFGRELIKHKYFWYTRQEKSKYTKIVKKLN
ncbi:hypothetical protein E308F_29750 [Moorella sp. E308F]|nr:hypothetical protein E308F_29750 [Moorella sp. E308F]